MIAGEVLDLFSAAAGGWSLGMHRAGFRTVAACESEAWRRALYAENNPHVRLYDDVRTLTAGRLLADLGRLPQFVVGSPPCQDISSANTKGRGVEGARSGLFFEAIRIIGEVRPRWFALENSHNLRTRGADAVISALEAIGYACWPLVVRAGDIGANHERPRCWLVGCDVEQVADADGFGRDEGRSGRWGGFDVPVSADTEHPARVGHEGGQARGHGSDGHGAAHAGSGDAADATRVGCLARTGTDEGSRREADGHEPADRAASGGAGRHPADAAGERPQGQLGSEQRRPGQKPERPDIPSGRKMDLCTPDSGHAVGSGPLWSLADFADHLWLDDGLSARLAGTRIGVGDGEGQSAASAIVEAFGDAVVPQIPEAIGRAIIRTEAALAAVYGADARSTLHQKASAA